ncbi:thioesterase family protein [Streptomyces sp. bgisy082]|uniref:thioesterase family protein n=1 Tax=unclassified Streptomyces TaxID=2593676 RepID=UPI003D7108F7
MQKNTKDGMGGMAEEVGPGKFLRNLHTGYTDVPEHLKGFGGLHGGLALGLVVEAMREHAGERELVSVTGRFGRAIDSPFRVATAPGHTGRSSSTVSGRVESERGTLLDSWAVFAGESGDVSWPVVEFPIPEVPGPEECEKFAIPKEFVPISTSMEIRPVGSSRPYAGGQEAELVAWVRLVEDDLPPDAPRFVLLMDALAPSYSAVLSTLAFVPTVEITVRPGAGLAKASSPWLLLRATTRQAGPSGWSSEWIDAWGPDGTHLGSAQQLRMVRGG